MSLPSKPGVYRFYDREDHILYVGKAIDLKSRVSSYFVNDAQLGVKTRVMVSQIDKVHITLVESELEALLLEAFYIKKFKPRYNVRMADNKTYPLIRITIKDTYPAIFLTRKAEDPNSLYFGPYPNVGAVKLVLKTIRRIFPYQSTSNHLKRVCLYNHLGLCPCPPVNDSPELQKEYKTNIRNIIRILEGEARKVLKEFESTRDLYSKNEDFEKAALMQGKITALHIITEQVRSPLEYDHNPNLRTDLRDQELATLSEILNKNNVSIGKITKIECYDISNIQGKYAVGSMVVFVAGEKESRLYRKYKIRREATPDDFASMEEVLTRRLKHTEWEYPELIIVDGGKGQITAARKALKKYNLTIPLVGLAKREETIVIPITGERVKGKGESHEEGRIDDSHNSDSALPLPLTPMSFVEVSLPKNSSVLHLIMRIRDEAHRFAITYHRNLRSKGATA